MEVNTVKRAKQLPPRRTETSRRDDYVGDGLTLALLRDGAAYRRSRLAAADMLSVTRAAALAGARRDAITTWIAQGRCIGLAQPGRGFRLPEWQFEAAFLPCVPRLAAALRTCDGWALLAFLESPLGALEGATPRQAIERGWLDRVLEIAAHAE